MLISMCGPDVMEQEVVSFAQSSLATTNDSCASRHTSDILDSSKFDLKLDKSNILMLGPTGCGEYYVST